MKSSMLLLAFGVSLSAAQGQGTLNFANLATGVSAPVITLNGTPIVGPSSYVADLYFNSDTNTVPDPLRTDSMIAAGFNEPFLTNVAWGGGWFQGGTKTVNGASGTILAQVRVWNTAFGQTYSQARDKGGEFGFSKPVVLTLSSAGSQQPVLVGLEGFQLQVRTNLPVLALGTARLVHLSGTLGKNYRLEYINRIGPVDAWVTLATLTLTNEAQVHLDISAVGRPERLYRLAELP